MVAEDRLRFVGDTPHFGEDNHRFVEDIVAVGDTAEDSRFGEDSHRFVEDIAAAEGTVGIAGDSHRFVEDIAAALGGKVGDILRL